MLYVVKNKSLPDLQQNYHEPCLKPTCMRMVSTEDKRQGFVNEHSHDVKYVLPKNPIKFNNLKTAYRHPIVVYADFEALLIDCDSPRKGFEDKQVPCTAAAVLVIETKVVDKWRYTGTDVINKFLEKMVEWQQEHIKNEYKMVPNADWNNEGCSRS